MSINQNPVNIASLQPGCIVAYRLLPQDAPLHPEKVWVGKVLDVSWLNLCCHVESLEDGYQGLREIVWLIQICGLSLDQGVK